VVIISDNPGGVPTWKVGGFVIRLYDNDHPPLHVHVFKDGSLVARYDLEHRCFMDGSDERFYGRIEKALGKAGLI
jgi:hypothetical protein